MKYKRGVAESPSGSSSDNSSEDEDRTHHDQPPTPPPRNPPVVVKKTDSVHSPNHRQTQPSSNSIAQPQTNSNSLKSKITVSRKNKNVQPNSSPVRSLATESNHNLNVQFLLTKEKLAQHVCSTGGNIIFNGRITQIVNTCNFEEMIFVLWVLSKYQNNFFQLLPQLPKTQALIETIQYIENITLVGNRSNSREQWNLAKGTFINNIMTKRPKIRRSIMDFEDDEHNNFVEPLKDFQTYNLRQICTAGCIHDGAILDHDQFTIYLNKVRNNVVLDYLWDGNCPNCGALFDVMPEFMNKVPNFLTIEIEAVNSQQIFFHELPATLYINGRNYKLVYASMYVRERNHYVGILKLDNGLFYIDSLPGIVEDFPYFHQTLLENRVVDGIIIHHRTPITATLYSLE